MGELLRPRCRDSLNIRRNELTHLKLHPGEQVHPVHNVTILARRSDGMATICGGALCWSITRRGQEESGSNFLCFTSWGMVPEKTHLERIAYFSRTASHSIITADAGWYGECEAMDDWVSQAVQLAHKQVAVSAGNEADQ